MLLKAAAVASDVTVTAPEDDLAADRDRLGMSRECKLRAPVCKTPIMPATMITAEKIVTTGVAR
ncbi:hypothetical protein GCM10009712_16050 [Pseudarthrobacter sulfonivorans]